MLLVQQAALISNSRGKRQIKEPWETNMKNLSKHGNEKKGTGMSSKMGHSGPTKGLDFAALPFTYL